MVESCLIIGIGQIGMGYDLSLPDESEIVHTHARAIFKHPGFDLIGAVDEESPLRAAFTQRYSVPAFDRVELALRELNPTLVVISTPTHSHAEILTRVLTNHRPKLIVCEKPLAYTLKDARTMVKMCEAYGVDLIVNYMRRSDPGVLTVKHKLDLGDIKAPVKVNAWYSKGLFNNGSHIINMLELWLGLVSNVKVISLGRRWKDHDPEPEFEMQFKHGTAVFRSAWEESFPYYCVELLSPSGRLKYDHGGEMITWQNVIIGADCAGQGALNKKTEIIQNGMNIYQWHVYNQIHKYMSGSQADLCTGHQALKTLESIWLMKELR